MNILVKGGTIITDSETYLADILISGSLIHQIGLRLGIPDNDTEVIDARGKFVFPGGIDPHVHMQLPTPAGPSSDDFYSGSRAALLGGTTSFVDFVTPFRGQSLIEALDLRLAESAKVLTGCTFHVSPVEWLPGTRDEIHACVKRGVKSFKVYMAYKKSVGIDDDVMLKVMQAVAEAGGIVIAHCEMGDEVELLRDQFAKQGMTAPLYHAMSRPSHTESQAVKRALELAAKAQCPFYVVHVSTKESLDYIREAQMQGQHVMAETCPQYLLLDDSKYNGRFEQTAPYVISPPLRKKADQDALWQALADGTLQAVGPDHCPFNFSQKEVGRDDFRLMPNGAGGVEHRLALLYTYGVLKKRITLNQFVSLTSTGPAQIFGLFPKKGCIAVGSDADLVIWNPDTARIISVSTHRQNCDTDIFEGIRTNGRPEYVIKGGKILVCKTEVKP